MPRLTGPPPLLIVLVGRVLRSLVSLLNHSSVLVFLVAGRPHLEGISNQETTHLARRLSADNPLGVSIEDDY